LAPVAVAACLGWSFPASAQEDGSDGVQQELAELRMQMQAMAARIDSLEGQLAEAKAQAAAASSTAAEAKIASQSVPKVTWKGAPQFEGDGGWSFKPRGRLQIDTGGVSAPSGINDKGLGFATEVRRAFLGVDGTLPGGFGYRAEVDVAASSVEITDLYMTYDASRHLTLTIGQHKPFWGMEELGSDLLTSFMERAAISSAFGYERRVGLSASYTTKDFLLQTGVFTDNAADLNNDENNSYSFDSRAVFMPKLAGGQFHLGGSIHYRELKDSGSSVRYRVRPFLHTTDTRFIDTGNINDVKSELGYGLELAYLKGPFHFAGETHWQKVGITGAADPTFFGGYAEVGYFLTKGDRRTYKGGVFDRTKPQNGFDKGGIGAIEVNLRYDYVDLIDAGIVGGKQNGYALSVIWTPMAYVRFMANYGHLDYDMAAIASGTSRNYGVDTFGMRAQFDF
jgi:phosphate-selective porin OprO/OprP